MFNRIIFAWIPLVLIILAPVIQVILSSLKFRKKIKLQHSYIFLIAMLLGFALPAIATLIAMSGLPLGVKCATGQMGLVILGWLISAVTIPLIAVITCFIHWSKQSRRFKQY